MTAVSVPGRAAPDPKKGAAELEWFGFTVCEYAPGVRSRAPLTNRNRLLVASQLRLLSANIHEGIVGGYGGFVNDFPVVVQHYPDSWWVRMADVCDQLASSLCLTDDVRCDTPAEEVAVLAATFALMTHGVHVAAEWRDALDVLDGHDDDLLVAHIPSAMAHELDEGLRARAVFDVPADDTRFPDDVLTSAGLAEFRPTFWFDNFFD